MSEESSFWAWFSECHDKYRSVNQATDNEALLDKFLEQLHAYDSDLYFEVSRPIEDGSNELIITAEGNREKFAKVNALVSAAPLLPKWEIIALKPPLGFEFVHVYDDLEINPKDLWFLPLTTQRDPSILGLRVGLPNFDDSNTDLMKNSVWIILDTGLGEQMCAERIRHLEVVALPNSPEDEGFIELPELPSYLDWIDESPMPNLT